MWRGFLITVILFFVQHKQIVRVDLHHKQTVGVNLYFNQTVRVDFSSENTAAVKSNGISNNKI
jgi:hypothetical protein